MMRALISMLMFISLAGWAQDGRGDIRFVFYNVENLFDPFNDSLTRDEEFLPGGIRHWTWDRFLEKEQKIYKVLASVGGWRPPEIIGLCEVENRFVLNWLIRETPLLKYNYRLVHRESPDERGIDVALLYLSEVFLPLKSDIIAGGGPEDPTRDILYVKGLVRDRDTIHIMICHWPSRWRGYLESQPDRLYVAGIVRGLFDSICSADRTARILIAGDFNDELWDPGLRDVLEVRLPDSLPVDTVLYHTGGSIRGVGPANDEGKSNSYGTIKYQGNWYEFDHIFVSGFLINDTSLSIKPGGKQIFAPWFLLEEDPAYTGSRPFRTYQGYRYHGGFSDHLPVYIDLWESK